MVTQFYRCLIATISAAILVLSCAGSLQAGWITIKNDTSKTLVVQEHVIVNGQIKRGKPINLLPGETLREYLPGPTVKRIEVFESQNPKEAVWSGKLDCKEDAQSFSIATADDKVIVGQVTSSPKK
jgi:hypothetical protein